MLSLHTQVVYLQQAANLPMIAQDKKKMQPVVYRRTQLPDLYVIRKSILLEKINYYIPTHTSLFCI
jgi:hypothetical protein